MPPLERERISSGQAAEQGRAPYGRREATSVGGPPNSAPQPKRGHPNNGCAGVEYPPEGWVIFA
jgi:hypothetical protein